MKDMTMSEASLRIMCLPKLTPYDKAYAMQKKIVLERSSGSAPNTLILLEHPPVITIGRSGQEQEILASNTMLIEQGIEVYKIERGGKVTYHGPGQIVGYVIINLSEAKMGVKEFVNKLEQTLIITAQTLGVEAFRKTKEPGVYCALGKIGAVGVRITKKISFHGFSFNVNPNLEHYKLINPCGMSFSDITSIEKVTGNAISSEKAKELLAKSFTDVFGI